MKRVLTMLFALLAAITLTSCGEASDDIVEPDPVVPVKFNVQIDVECTQNLLLNKYDVAVLIDSNELGVLDHGTKKTFNAELEEGVYTLSFEEEGDSSVDGSVDIEISKDTRFRYRIFCKGSQIEIQEIKVQEAVELSDSAKALVTNPSVAYVVECLKNVPSIIGIEVDRENNGPVVAGLRNSAGTVFFSSDLVDQGSVRGETVLKKGTDGGGSIDILSTVEEAVARDEYLATFDETFFEPGSHIVVGTLVVRISSELSEEDQVKLQTSIIEVLTAGNIAEPAVSEDAWVAEGSGAKVTGAETKPEEITEPENEPSETTEPEIPEDKQEESEFEVSFSKEYAKRAAVVAMTNAQATDVFTADGSKYDPSKFHSYDDVSGFYMSVYEDGSWVAKDATTWHVDGLTLDIAGYDTYVKASLDVTFDGKNYIISNVTRVIANLKYLDSNDPSKINIEEMNPSASNPFLTVAPELVEKERAETPATESLNAKDTARTNWIESQFSWWDGSHNELEELIISSLNDEKSYKHIDTTYIDVKDETLRDSVNSILQSSGYSRKAEIGDLFIMTEFSAKNAFGGTIKSTAFGISSYANNTISLIGIE